MSIHITYYKNGMVNYLKENIPSKMGITETMIKETFPNVEKTYPMILGLLDEQLVILIDKYHTLQNHIACEINTQDVYLDYKTF
jgi:ribosomal protein S15P/S13E